MLAMIGARARQRAAAERQQAQEGGLVRLASPCHAAPVSLVVCGSPALVGVGLWEIFRSRPCQVDEERDRTLALAAQEHFQTINGCNVDIPWGREISRATHLEPAWLACAKVSGLWALGGATGERKPPIAVGIPVPRHPCTNHPCAPRPPVTARGVLEASPRGRPLPRRRRSRACRTGRPRPSHPGGLRWLAALAPGRVRVRTSASGPWRPCSRRPCPRTATACATAVAWPRRLRRSSDTHVPTPPRPHASIDNTSAHATISAPHAQRLPCGLSRCGGAPVRGGPRLVHRAMRRPRAHRAKETCHDPGDQPPEHAALRAPGLDLRTRRLRPSRSRAAPGRTLPDAGEGPTD